MKHFKLTVTFNDQALRWYCRVILDNFCDDSKFLCVDGSVSDLASFLEYGYKDQDSYGRSVDKFISRFSALSSRYHATRVVMVNSDDFMALVAFCSNKLTGGTASFEAVDPSLSLPL